MPGKEYAFYDRTAMMRRKFPLTSLMLLASTCLWVCIFTVSYYVITLSLLYMEIRQEGDLQTTCPKGFSTDPAENAHHVESYPTGVAGPYIVRMSPERSFPSSSSFTSPPTVVTAVSSADFYLAQGLVRHIIEDIQPHHSDIKLVIYDVGLYSGELKLLEKYCHCEVRRFTTTEYPTHVADFSNFAWRPILMQNALSEFGSIIFIEPGTRFKSASSLSIVQHRGWRDFLVWDLPVHESVVAYTSPSTFQYLGEDRCIFQETGMIDSQIFVLYNTNTTWRLMMKPWLKCALSAECISPPGSRPNTCFHMRRPRTTGCHRYDISALSITLNRALQVTINRNKYIPQRVTYSAEEGEVIFPEQPWRNWQLWLIVLSPLILYILWGIVCSKGKFKFR